MMQKAKTIGFLFCAAFHAGLSMAAPEIDGVVETDEWSAAEIFLLGYETFPAVNAAAKQRTEARYLVVDGHLFVSFVAYDTDVQAIRARRRERDAIFEEDSVGLVIAPGGIEADRAFYFFVTAGGTQFDSQWSESKGAEDVRWDARWRSTVRLNDDGYSVEMRIPLVALPLAAGREQRWAINFVRVLPREYRYEMASQPRDRNRPCLVCQLSPIQISIDHTQDWRAFEAQVDSVYQHGSSRAADGDTQTEHNRNLGFSLTLRPRYSISAALTLNPDFSQVEADVLRPVTNAADAFFYDDRRPFFVEAGQPFAQMLPLFYSRAISEPDAAFNFRFRNQSGDTSLLYARDIRTQLIEPGLVGSRLIEYRAADGSNLPSQALALRTQQNRFGSAIGATVTARQADGYRNSVAAVDTRIPLAATTTFNAAWAFSETTLPTSNAQGMKGSAFVAQITRSTLHWYNQIAFEHRDEDFRADLGSIFRVGILNGRGIVRRTFRFERNDLISEASVQLDGFQRTAIDGALVDNRAQISASLAGAGQTRATVWLFDGHSRFRDRLWSRAGWEMAVNTSPSEAWQASFGLLWSDDVDRLGLRRAELRQGSAALNWTPSDAIRWSYQTTYRRLLSKTGKLFDEQLHDLRGYYFFSNDFYLRGTVRAWALDRPPGSYPGLSLPRIERQRDWQLLVAWRPTLGTFLYAGISRGRDVDDLGLADPAAFVQRTLFLKASVSFDNDGIIR